MSATLQTAVPLSEFWLSERSWAFSNYILWAEKDRLELDAPYQRGEVWGLVRQRMLIRSVLEGLPIGAVIVNDRLASDWPETQRGAASYAVIDGKQRITTLLRWHANDLTVPAPWFPAETVLDTEPGEDGPYVSIGMLSLRQQARMENFVMLTYEAQVPDLASERVIFERINFGGIPQGEGDVDLMP